MKLPHAWSKATPLFDDERLVSCAGLVPVMALAEQTGLAELIRERVAGRARNPGGLGGGEPGREGDLDHRGDGRVRGQHR